MADDVLTRAGPVAVPLDYKLPTGTEIVPRSVSASFDGSSAGGAFVPLLEVIAPTGAVTAYCARQVSIAAGASVLVSWFPGVAEADEQASVASITSISSTAGTIVVSQPSGPATNVDLKQTGVLAGSYGDATDSAEITVDTYGRITAATSVPIAGGGSVVASDGWVPDTTETWTFASFTAGPPAVGTFTVPGDLRAKYTVGTRIKLVQTTTKYFLVTADPTYDGTKTTVQISGGTDYTLANAAISGNYHSYVVNPQGFPTWFNATPSSTGFSSKALDVLRFCMFGRKVTVDYASSGTSNATTFTWTLPVQVGASQNTGIELARVTDNSSSTTIGAHRISAGSSTATMGFALNAGGGFTASGTKGAQGTFDYEA